MNKKTKETERIEKKKVVRKQLFRVLNDEILSPSLVSAIAGDKEFCSRERNKFSKLLSHRGDDLYVDLLFSLTHQYYPVETAKHLWNKILAHKHELSIILGRNVGINVAALDYLSNISNQIENPAIITKSKMTNIADVALKDGLSGLYDSSTFREKLNIEIKRYKRYGDTVSLIMIDIDDFKKYNDSYGHQNGDRVISIIGGIINKLSRELDICARYGGEEFTIILPQTDIKEASIIANRISSTIAEKFSSNSRLTVSIGVASCPNDAKTANGLVLKADKALYRSKKNGKNQVTTC